MWLFISASPLKTKAKSTKTNREGSIGILAAVAKPERARFSGRIKAGQARGSNAPARPALADDVVAELRRLRGEKLSFKKMWVAMGVPVATVHKYPA